MNDWQQFLQQHSAQFQQDAVQSFGETPADYNELLQSGPLLFDLSYLNILTVADGANAGGADKLLQGQLTCDLNQLSANNSLTGAQCTPKGRAIANFRLVKKTDNAIHLVMPAEQVSAVQQSLGKYAPFFKAAISTEDNIRILGLAGPGADQLCRQLLEVAPTEPHQCVHTEQGSAIQLPDGRYLLLVSTTQAQSLWQQLSDKATAAGSPLWTLLDIRAGLADITAATREAFVPQMLNLQATGGISFKKGCYTGQEVVARMHYLGKTKRRMYRLKIRADNTPDIGDNCYITGKAQSQGTVVSAAKADDDTVELLAVLTSAAADSDQLSIGVNDNPQPIEVLPLPYSLED